MEINKKNIGLAGCGLLVLGTFLPIVRLPMVGSINYFNNGNGDGIYIIIIAIISLFLILKKNTKLCILQE